MRDVDAVVVGGGVMGAAAAWRLARRGRQVVVLEQFHLGHDHGSSHGSVRVFRFSYDDPLFVGMAMEALPLWRELEEESARTLLTITGGFDSGSIERLEANAKALASRGASFDLIDGAELMRRFPAISVPADSPILHQRDAGFIFAELAVRTFAERAQERGAVLRERSPVLGVRSFDDRVEVMTAEDTFRARVAIVTAGSWARGLLEGEGIDLPVVPSRETVAFFALSDEAPVPVLVEWTAPPTYALPSPGQGLKAGWHRSGPEADPDQSGPVDARVIDHLSAWVAEHYPSADAQPHHTETCMYTNTADESFILERHGPIVVGSACSGHGFKFAPLIGERLAQLASS